MINKFLISNPKYCKEDASLETLLDLDGETYPMDTAVFGFLRGHTSERWCHTDGGKSSMKQSARICRIAGLIY
jgi:hypothetical protein